jgi:hypothetical protein
MMTPGWSATRKLSPDHAAKSWLVGLPDKFVLEPSCTVSAFIKNLHLGLNSRRYLVVYLS